MWRLELAPGFAGAPRSRAAEQALGNKVENQYEIASIIRNNIMVKIEETCKHRNIQNRNET